MGERTLAWHALNYLQTLDVMRQAETAILAVCADRQPYMTPMHVQLEMDGMQPVVHLSGRGEGRRLQYLQANDRGALLYRRETCMGTDTVLAEGCVEIVPVASGVLLRFTADMLSGRRYFF